MQEDEAEIERGLAVWQLLLGVQQLPVAARNGVAECRRDSRHERSFGHRHHSPGQR